MRNENWVFLWKRIAHSVFFCWVILRERNFGHTHTQKGPSTYLKFSSPTLFISIQKRFCIVEWEMKIEYSHRIGSPIIYIWLRYYYKSVILVIHTHKSTVVLIETFSSPQLIRRIQKWFCIVEWEMKTESVCGNGLPIPLFFVDDLEESVILVIYTHKSTWAFM